MKEKTEQPLCRTYRCDLCGNVAKIVEYRFRTEFNNKIDCELDPRATFKPFRLFLCEDCASGHTLDIINKTIYLLKQHEQDND